MIRIGNNGAPISEDHRTALDQRDASLSNEGGPGTGLHSGFGNTGFRHKGGEEREAAFMEHMRHALHANGVQEEDAGQETERSPLLLAMAGGSGSLPLVDAGTPASTPTNAPRLSEDMRVRIAGIVSRVETAINTEMFPRGEADLRVSFDLPTGDDGIGNIAVKMTAASIEIVLGRTAPDMLGDSTAAAQVLAERLRQRFPRRVVSILEIKIAEEPLKGGSMAEISRLLVPTGNSD